jgi:1-deoxy-D-xylulose-5-phosphate reductoisomerase
MKKRIAILGSTGSIGTQALDVVREHPAEFTVEVLTGGDNADLLIKQAVEFQPNMVVVGNESLYSKVSEALAGYDIKVYAGAKAIEDVVETGTVDLVLMAIMGFAALRPTFKAIDAGKNLAIANKETFVVAGEIMVEKAGRSKTGIIPVDSEHSAIFQCLAGEYGNPVEKIYLTASGGPFRGKSVDFLKSVKASQALRHPNWDMGAKITIDSATMMNKGFEMIEAKWLFGLQPHQIDVLVHPQSIVHSMVQFEDGSLKAQMGLPDMKLPIQYAMAYPQRLKNNYSPQIFLDQLLY